MVNPVWNRFVIEQMPKWLEWCANNPLNSHLEMLEKFIMANPYYIVDIDEVDRNDELLNEIMVSEEFIYTLTDKGLKVWYYSNFKDLLEVVSIYAKNNRDIRALYRVLCKYLWWFERVYAYVREGLAKKLEVQGRSFK